MALVISGVALRAHAPDPVAHLVAAQLDGLAFVIHGLVVEVGGHAETGVWCSPCAASEAP